MTQLIDCAVAGVPRHGETESGDLCVVAAFDGGVLVTAIDGLGHGCEAARAARSAAEVLTAHASEPLLRLVERCHEACARPEVP